MIEFQALDHLRNAVAPGAFHDSGERFPPPQCHPETRLEVTKRIMDWINGKENTESLIIWLHGGAGAGKSAIAQRIAELCHKANILLASYFASNRADPRRKDANYIIPTIAYQITQTIPAASQLLEEEIIRDPLVFTRSLEVQMTVLIIRPLQPLIAAGLFADPISEPRLVIIDGLDELVDRTAQTNILKVISDALQVYRIPLIFLIASRPEQEISHSFSIEPLSTITGRLLLDKKFLPDSDIRIFLDDSFLQIKKNHPQRNTLPPDWPLWHSIDELVKKSSGHFIYASTVVGFINQVVTDQQTSLILF